ncbi:tRNA (mnm(5)s(2)U34)-methyltransferase [Calidifontibacillus oryziterrae]|uniref:tRNA (mnm(5)s(2)U34)-methyltransferase n=1 Tax=Calidifontibacillus oryziterrae TaxID=1191699 RepID=UPI000319946A|nr:class I SAM-dependent methyltransferase [Calidifontibacillus oryziterrae]
MTTLKRVLPFAHYLLAEVVTEGDIAIDATVGNGNDTTILAQLVGDSGKVYGFDIQEQAIQNTKRRLENGGLSNRVELFQTSHASIEQLIPNEYFGKIKAAIFNLGYLPGGDKNIVTTPSSTIDAIQQLLAIMAAGGLIILVVYHGHPEGQLERDQLLQYVTALDQKKAHVLQYQFLNQINHAPFIIAIEKQQL